MKIIIRNLSNEAVLKILKSDGNKTEIPPKKEACFLAYDHEFLFLLTTLKNFLFLIRHLNFLQLQLKRRLLTELQI